MNDEQIELELRGKTWHVYYYMLLKGANAGVSVREVQHSLGLSSPSVAMHHLERLSDLGLAKKAEGGGYVLNGEVKVGVLRHFVRLGKLLVPRYVYYAAFTTVLTLLYCTLLWQSADLFASYFVLAIGAFSSAAFWYEAYRFWRLKPYQNVVQRVPVDRIKSLQRQSQQQVKTVSAFNQGVKVAVTASLGVAVAVILTAFLGMYFGRLEPALSNIMLIAGLIGIVALVAFSALKRSRSDEGAADKGFEAISTAAAIGLLLFTPMLSGAYLIIMPIACVVLLIAFVLMKWRRVKD